MSKETNEVNTHTKSWPTDLAGAQKELQLRAKPVCYAIGKLTWLLCVQQYSRS